MNEKMLTPIQNANVNPFLEFRDGQVLFRMNSLAGTMIEKLISWEAVRAAALNIPIDSGWLPSEVVRWGTGKHGEWAVAFIPPGRQQLELTVGTPGESEEIERITAPLPGMVMFGGGSKYFVWAQKTEKIEPHHEIFRCPLPNVMQDASICWGLLKPPQASPRTILKAWQIFITSTFNNHAANGKSKKNREDVRVLLKDLAQVHKEGCSFFTPPVRPCDCGSLERERYPVEDLVRQVDATGVTLDKAIREFWDSGVMPG